MVTFGRGRKTATFLAATLVAAVLAGSPPATAAAPWLPPVELASPQANSVGTPSVATAPDGTTATVFLRYEGLVNRVYAVVRAPGGALSAPAPLSDPGVNSSAPQVAIDAQGTATAAWLYNGGTVQASTRVAGGAWSPAQSVSAPGAQTPDIDSSVNGATAISWAAGSGTTENVQVSVRLPGIPGFPNFPSPVTASTTVNQTASGVFATPQVAIDGQGNTITIWQRNVDFSGTPRWVNETAFKASSSPVFAASEIRSTSSAGGAGSSFDVGMTTAGRAFAIWDYNDGAALRIEYAERLPGAASWVESPSFPKVLLATPGVYATSPMVALGENNAVVVAWFTAAGLTTSVRVAPGLSFGVPKVHAPSASSPTIAIAPSGEALLAWAGPSSSDFAVFAVRRPAGGEEFGGVGEVVKGRSTAPATIYNGLDAGLDDQGNGFVAASRVANSPTEYTPVLLGLDNLSPVLAAVNVPGVATAGSSVGMSAGASDRMSTPTLGWAFGDGGTATGSSVSHAFASPGVYTVTVTATDGGGNQSSTSRQVQVSAASPVPGPKISATSKLAWSARPNGGTTIRKLTVSGLQKSDVVTLKCKGKGCLKKASAKLTATGNKVSFSSRVKGMTLAPKATLVIVASRPGAAPLRITYKMVKGKAPKKSTRYEARVPLRAWSDRPAASS